MLNQSAYRTASDAREVYHNVVVALKNSESLNNGQASALAIWIAALARSSRQGPDGENRQYTRSVCG